MIDGHGYTIHNSTRLNIIVLCYMILLPHAIDPLAESLLLSHSELALGYLYELDLMWDVPVNITRFVFFNAGLLVTVLGMIAYSNLAQSALAATTNTTPAKTTTIVPPAPTNKLTAMPGSLDSAKLHLAEALKDIKTGNIEAAAVQIKITNQTITQFQQGMLNIMNTPSVPSNSTNTTAGR